MHVSVRPEGNGLEWAWAAGVELVVSEQAPTRKVITSAAMRARRRMLVENDDRGEQGTQSKMRSVAALRRSIGAPSSGSEGPVSSLGSHSKVEEMSAEDRSGWRS